MSDTMQVEKLSSKVLMQREMRQNLGNISIHVCFLEDEPMKEMTWKKVMVIKGHGEVSITEAEGESSEKKGWSIKPHEDLRSQGPSRHQTTGVFKLRTFPTPCPNSDMEKAVSAKKWATPGYWGWWVSADCSECLTASEGNRLVIRTEGAERDLCMNCVQFSLFFSIRVAFKSHKKPQWGINIPTLWMK